MVSIGDVLEIELQKINYLQMFIEENKAESSSVSQHIANTLLAAAAVKLKKPKL